MKIKPDVCAYVKITPYTCDFILRNQSVPYAARLETAIGWKKFLNMKTALKKFDPVTGELYRDVENELRALRRARKSVVDYALCNDFEYFGTITIDDKRWDISRPDILQKAISMALHSYQQNHPNLKYIFTAEYGEETHRLHFHFLATGLETFINEHNHPDCHLFRDRFGWCQIARIGETEQDKVKSSLYCSKYIRKQSIRVAHRYFFNSHNLKKPDKIFLKGTLALMAYDELRKINSTEFAHTKYLKCHKCRASEWCEIWERISVYKECFRARALHYSRFDRHVWLYKPIEMTTDELRIFYDNIPEQMRMLE